MTPRQQVSRAAVELVKRFEGRRLKAVQLPDGRWMIGYGHTLSARAGAEVTDADAEALLRYDLMGVANTVNDLVYADLTQNQFDALCAFAFSIGLEAFRRSDVLKRVNEGAFTEAAFALELWRKAEFQGERIVVDALVRRRAAEKLLFLTPPNDAWRPVPSALVKPELDETAVSTAPREPSADLGEVLDGEAASIPRLFVPEPPAHPENPVKAAAEAVSARLQTLFVESVSETEAASAFEVDEELFAPAPREEAPAEAEPPPLEEALEAEPQFEPAPEPPPPEPEPEPEPVALELEAEAPGEPPEAELDPMPRLFREPILTEPPERIVIDDTAPYEFVAAPVQPLPAEHGNGFLVMVSLMALGLAFFAGGIFWAFNAAPGLRPGVFTPLLVGWLAGVAGAGFFAAAVFMALQRMTRAAERRDRRRI